MNNNLSNSAGLVSFNILNVNTLYIEGVLFEGGGTGGLQAQIDAIDATLNNDILPITNRIDLTGLTGNLVITDTNKNSVLKTAVDNINTQIAGFNKFDLTGLTGIGSCVITNATTNQALNGLIATNTSNIASNTSSIVSNTTAIGINTSNIATNTSNIATNTNNIATNTSNIATNTSAISSINSQITSINNSITAINAKLANISVWTVGGTTMTGIRNNTGFAIDHSADDSSNGLFVYPNGDAHNAQVRIETAQDKQLYMRGGGAVTIYAGANGTVLNRNTILIGDESDHIQIGSFSGAVKFPLIYIGTSGSGGIIPSQTQMRGSWFFNNFTTSIYDGILCASGVNQLITAKTAPFLSGLTVVAPVDIISLTALAGGIALTTGAGLLALTCGIGGITISCAGGACSINTGGGAMSINLGAGVLNMASGTGNSNWTTINGDLYLGAGKGTGGSAGSINLRAIGTISISPDTNTEIDKTSYVEMKDGSAPATTTRKLYHTGGELWYNGNQLSNQTTVKSLVAGSGINLSNASGAWTISAITPTLSQVLYAGNTANVPIFMNNQDITGVKDIVGVNCQFSNTATIYNLVPTFISGWNVKSLVSGGGINLTNNFGAWTISATATTPSLSQVLAVGSSGNEMTLTTANITTGNFNTINTYNITGWEVKSLTAGSNISITNTSGNYTISATGSGGGETNFILQNTTNIVNFNVINTMTTTYTSTAGTTITRNAYTANIDYAMGQFKSGYILGVANQILSGVYTADLYGLLTSNQPSYLYSKFFHIAERSSPTTEFVIDKTLTYINDVDSSTSTYLQGSPIIIPVASNALSSINVYSVSFPAVRIIGSGGNIYMRYLLKNQAGTTLYTSNDVPISSSDSTATRTFDIAGGNITHFYSITTSYYVYLEVYSTNGTSVIVGQPKKRSTNDCVYQLKAIIKHLMYDGTTNKTLLTNGIQTLYQLTIPFPFSAYDISVFTNYSKIQYEPFFIQPSGHTTNHSMVLFFQDGALSHLSTSISASTTTTPTLSQVLTAGATASTNIDMNNNSILNVNGLSCQTLTYNTLIPAITQTNNIFEGYPTYVNVGTFTSNGFIFSHNWDFQKYEYDITIDLSTLQTTFSNTFLRWYYDVETANQFYRQNWLDFNGSSFFGTGEKNENTLIYLYQDAPLHHNWKATLRQAYSANDTFYQRLVLEASCVQTPYNSNTATFNGNFRTSRAYNQRISQYSATPYAFNGTKNIAFYVDMNNYFTTTNRGTGNQMFVRIVRRPIK